MSYELYLPPEPTGRNAVTGRFMKGHVPANKGKKWSEYLSKSKQRRCAKGWKNLDLYRCKGGGPNAGRAKKQVVAVMDDGRWTVFPFVRAAAEWCGGSRENVGRCCRCNQAKYANKKTGGVNTDHKYKGVRFYFESDNTWLEKIDR